MKEFRVGRPIYKDGRAIFVGYHTTANGWCDNVAVFTADIIEYRRGDACRFGRLVVRDQAAVVTDTIAVRSAAGE